MTVYNVIILDKSGSMSSIARQAVDGVNETIGSIKSAQEKNPDQKHMVTLKPLTDKDYRPCCMTPLYDAVGTTISRVHAMKSKESESLALVTIITDGYENASHEFTQSAIRALIESYKEQGWQFTYIGADHDVQQVSFSLSIDHCMQFDKSEAGTQAMFAKERRARNCWMSKLSSRLNAMMTEDERDECIKEINKENFF